METHKAQASKQRYSGMLQESVVATLHDGSAYTEVQSQCIYVNQHPACLLANAQGLLLERKTNPPTSQQNQHGLNAFIVFSYA